MWCRWFGDGTLENGISPLGSLKHAPARAQFRDSTNAKERAPIPVSISDDLPTQKTIEDTATSPNQFVLSSNIEARIRHRILRLISSWQLFFQRDSHLQLFAKFLDALLLQARV